MADVKIRNIILDEVDASNSKDIIQKVLEWNFEDDLQSKTVVNFQRLPINIIVNSYGGYVYPGSGIVGVLSSSKTPIHTYCYGHAMSMGFLVYVCGQKRFATSNATFMYHTISCCEDGSLNKVKGNIQELERMEKIFDDLIVKRTKIPRNRLEEVRGKSFGDWYMSTDDAVSLGVVDEIIGSDTK